MVASWKKLALIRDGFKALNVGPGHKWSIDTFHEYVRKQRLGKWLQGGKAKVHKLGKSLCPHLDVSATPSEKMLLAAKTKKAQASALHEGGSSRHASASGMEKRVNHIHIGFIALVGDVLVAPGL